MAGLNCTAALKVDNSRAVISEYVRVCVCGAFAAFIAK